MAENSEVNMLSWQGSDKFYNPYIGRGEVLFTGPDGIKDHQVSVIDCKYVGIGTMSTEGTSDLNYLWRATQSCPHPPPKSIKVGEIGWGLRADQRLLRSGHQIRSGEFRQSCEDRHTHLYQNPWYPGPGQLGAENLPRSGEQRDQVRPHTTPGGTRPAHDDHEESKAARMGAARPRSGTHSSSTSVLSHQA